jgi:ubiquinone/menaquinone biosynthesis C-methylase UbiE
MRAERLRYDDASFDTTVVFFLLHELPTPSRHAALTEAIRVTRPGGQIMFSEYGEHGKRHWFHRFQPFRGIITWAEPFLSTFWKENLTEVLEKCAASLGRRIELEEGVDIFGGFYRVRRYRVL